MFMFSQRFYGTKEFGQAALTSFPSLVPVAKQRHTWFLRPQPEKQGATTDAIAEANLLVSEQQVAAWLPHRFFRPCPAYLERAQKWVGIRSQEVFHLMAFLAKQSFL